MAIKTIRVIGQGIQKEKEAGGTITPGDLVDVSAATIVVHASAGGNASPTFAVEDDIQGNGIDDDYSSGDNVLYAAFEPGAEVYAWLAAGENASIGSYLESNGDGTLRVLVADMASGAGAIDTHTAVARATAALDLSASGTVDTRLVVEIL